MRLAVSVNHFGFPHTAQVIQVTRKTRELHTRRWRTVQVYAVTSLPHARASPARLADLIRGHWGIETLHHLRDVTFTEDACKVCTGAGPHVMATLRNLVIGVLCRRARSTSRRLAPPRPRPRPALGHPRHHPGKQPRLNGHEKRGILVHTRGLIYLSRLGLTAGGLGVAAGFSGSNQS